MCDALAGRSLVGEVIELTIFSKRHLNAVNLLSVWGRLVNVSNC